MITLRFSCLLLSVATLFCRSSTAQPLRCPAIRVLKPVAQQTMPDLGSAQGIFLQRSEGVFQTTQESGSVPLIWLYGDAETGVARQYRLASGKTPKLEPTGQSILLTHNGYDAAPHPTGLTYRPEMPFFLGDTVNQKGLIFTLDPEQIQKSGSLDQAVLNVTLDDLSLNGTRPEYVRFQGDWVIATTEYGNEGNELRLYDPAMLAKVTRTSLPGVLLAKWPCGPWTQSLHWVDEFKTLVFVQNQIAGLKYRLVCARFLEGQLQQCEPIDLPFPVDELEGFAFLGGPQNLCLLLSSSRQNNATFAEWIEAD